MGAVVALELLVGSAVGAGVLYMWGWRRVKYVAGAVKRHKRAEQFERDLTNARAHLAVATPYRAATPDDAALIERLAVAQPHHESLVACGFAAVGDLIAIGAENEELAVVRALVDREHTTCALIVVRVIDPPVAMLQLSSFADSETFSTRVGNLVSLAEPPSVHRQVVAAGLAHIHVSAKHRELAGGAALVAIATRDELIAQLTNSRLEVTRWRDAQPSDELLDADLRAVLGDAYPRWGKVWMRRLRGRLPQATLRAHR